MTREQFYETCDNWSDLVSFCSIHGLFSCDDIFLLSDVATWIRDTTQRLTPYQALTKIQEAIDCVDFGNYEVFKYEDGAFTELGDDDDIEFNDYQEKVVEEYANVIGFDNHKDDVNLEQSDCEDGQELDTQMFTELCGLMEV